MALDRLELERSKHYIAHENAAQSCCHRVAALPDIPAARFTSILRRARK